MKIRQSINKYRISILIIIVLTLISSALAAPNNPGHDTLYIEQTGDSEITGNLNISGNVSAETIIYSGVDLDLRGDSYGTSSSNNQIIGGSSWLSIQSLGEIYINTLQGTNSMVYLGDGSGAIDTVSLNITGALYVLSGTAKVGGQNICLANGTGCPTFGTGSSNSTLLWIANGTGLNGGNITTGGSLSLQASGITASTYGSATQSAQCTFDTYGRATACSNQTITVTGGTGSGNVNGSGNSGYIALWNGTTSINNSVIFQNSSNIGIGTTTPSDKLVIAQTEENKGLKITSVDTTKSTTLSVGDSGYATLSATNGVIIDSVATTISQNMLRFYDGNALVLGTDYDFKLLYDETTDDRLEITDGDNNNLLTVKDQGTTADFAFNTNSLIVNSSGYVGIGTTNPAQKLQVAGNVNVSGYNMSTVNCIIFDSGGKICSGS